MAAENLGHAVVAVAWIFAAIATGVVGARLYVCLRIMRKVSIDDYIVFLTLLLGIGDSVFLTISYSWGLGTHIHLIEDPLHISYTIKWVYLCEFFSIMCPGFGRISYAFLLLRVVPPPRPRRYFLWAIISIQFVVDVGTVIVSFLQCRPIEGFWNHRVEAECWTPYVQEYVGFVQSSICSAVDLILAIFPASLFWNLNMELKQKVSLSIIMGLGILLEAYLVLLAASIPSLRPLSLKKVKSQRSPSQGEELSSFQSWKRARASNQENIGRHGLFQGYETLNEITRDETYDGVTDAPFPQAVHSWNGRGRNGRDSVIRKDVTVMVSSGAPVTGNYTVLENTGKIWAESIST
ncbi:integral membrane protein [Hypoxylon sp. FL1150]|nr:integral membrane protein [Hypoxylon sp. FL1150]